MTLQDFQRLLRARPFQPFRVIMSSGERYEVRHPEMAFLLRTKLVLGLDPDSQGVADDWVMCSLLHITAVEPIRPAARPPGGHDGRRSNVGRARPAIETTKT